MFSTIQIGLVGLAMIANASAPLAGATPSEPPPIIEAKPQTVEEAVIEISRENGVKTNVALAIAFCESANRQFDETGKVLRGRENSQDVGVFQINEKYHLEKSRKLGYDIYTTKGNIEYAMYLFETQGRQPWVHSKPCWGSKIS